MHPRPAPPLVRRRLAHLGLLLALLCAACGSDRRPAETRLLVVGWDGATWELIDPLLAQGRLPNLAKLMARGTHARLESTIVPISSAAWAGATTGRDPAHTGVYGFFEPVPDSYDVTLISARSNKATPIWRTLGRRGGRSVVVGVPATYPPEPIEGVMVSGMLAPEKSVYTSPAALTERLRARGYLPDLGIWREAIDLSGPLLERQMRAKRAVLLELLEGEDWDLAFLVFKELDVLSHFAYDGDPKGMVATFYERLDLELGVLLDAVGPDTRVMVVSDHGFHAYSKSFFPQRWLLEQGYSVANAKAPPVKDLSHLPLAQRRALENGLQMAELDMDATRAFAGLSEGNFGGIRLNLRGREPRGCVDPSEAEALLDLLDRRLSEVRVPGTGDFLVGHTWRRAELYSGPFEDLLPDLLFETHPEVAVRPVSHVAVFEAHDDEPNEPRYPDHKREGVLVAAGPGIAAYSDRRDFSIFDVGPTALHMLGHAIYSDLDGRVLVEIFAAPQTPRVVSEADEVRLPGEKHWLEDRTWTDPEMEEVQKQLQALGYVKGG